jgi:hypothetical protein
LKFIRFRAENKHAVLLEEKIREKVPKEVRKFGIPPWLYTNPIGHFIYHPQLRYIG